METRPPRTAVLLVRVLHGIEAGIIGGAAMLALLAAASIARGEVWWGPLNLLGSTFSGARALRAGPGMASVSGAALQEVITGGLGAIFGLLFGGVRSPRRLLLWGAAISVLWYYLADAILWSRINPLVSTYTSPTAAILAHALFGACLGSMGRSEDIVPPPLPLPSPPMLVIEADAVSDAVE